MAYLSRADRRAAILEAAIAVMLRDGFAPLTTRAVAAELHAANGIIHHHFASAQALRREAFAHFYATECTSFDDRCRDLPAAEALRLFLADPLTDTERRMRLWVGAWNEAQQDAEFAVVYAAALRDSHRRLAELIGTCAAAGARVDADSVAWRLQAIGLGLACIAATPAGLLTPEACRKLLAETVRGELGIELEPRTEAPSRSAAVSPNCS
ncbi:MAG: TetR family transcriptional regulator C-terminal domain-containing protein [Rhizobiales bacterium]|nr:TetR family transcriptional regulator C-terminal domain-containing protein [Hyphomicrobiales bacterium]